jgi:hypothetical protein
MDRLFITNQMMLITIKHVIFMFQYSELKSELKLHIHICDNYAAPFKPNKNKTANCLSHDRGQRRCQEILHIPDVIRFHGIRVNVISQTPVSTSRPVTVFTEVTNVRQHKVQISSPEFRSNRLINVENADRN